MNLFNQCGAFLIRHRSGDPPTSLYPFDEFLRFKEGQVLRAALLADLLESLAN
jgi:hypothetical protein